MSRLSKEIGQLCLAKNLKIVTAESCTAGLIGATIAQTPGSSAWLDSGFIVYTPEAKNSMLGVKLETIEKYNITSVEVAHEMAQGALERSNANISIAVTGVAGPSGGTDEIPVGTVCIGFGSKGFNGQMTILSEKVHFKGNRNQIRKAVVDYVLQQILQDYA